MMRTNRLESYGYNTIMDQIRMGDFGDPWGTGMAWCFALAEVLYVEYGEISSEFRPSPLMEEGDRESVEGYEAETLFELIDDEDIDQSDIQRVYQIVSRYVDWVRLAGRDY